MLRSFQIFAPHQEKKGKKDHKKYLLWYASAVPAAHAATFHDVHPG